MKPTPLSPAVTTLSAASAAALELPEVLALYAELASTDLGGERLRSRRPVTDPAELALRRAAYEEVCRLSTESPLVASFEEPLAPLLGGLGGGGRAIGGRELVLLARLLRQGGDARARIFGGSSPGAPAGSAFPALAELASGTADLRPLATRIERTLDRRGEVREDATPELSRLRSLVRRARDQVYAELGGVVARHQDLLDDQVPLRGGRLMLILDAGARGRLPGLVHGRSATGKSFYFEPLEVVETNNQLQQAGEDEAAERQRILAELIAAVLAEQVAIDANAALIAELDALEAARRLVERVGGRLADLAGEPHPGASETTPPAKPELMLRGACHPLLDPRLAELRERALGAPGHLGPIVPLDLTLGGEGARVLVVTGPNAGGKTVVLKTLGVLAALHQCGLPIPVAAGSRLPWLARLVATVGDEQDLLSERSTFSGRLLRLHEAWDAAASGQALVLLDELGSGTDPEEGAALAIALVEALVGVAPHPTNNLSLVTTHLTALAAASLELPGAGCAAMEFLPETGRPSYRLLPGPPGGSEALALGRRLGLPAEWLDRAEELLGDEHRDLRRLLGELEAARQEVAVRRAELEVALADATTLGARLDRERAASEAERRSLAKRLERELEAFRRDALVKLRGEAERVRQELTAAPRLRGVAEAAVERLLAAAPVIETTEVAPSGPLVVGSQVRHRRLGWAGALERLSGERAEVVVRGKRVRVDAAELEMHAGPAAGSSVRTEGERRPPRRAAATRPPGAPDDELERAVPSELHLIGRRVEESLVELDAWLDAALLAGGTQELRVVHGHGSGRLREAVRQHLRRHPAVATSRPGGDGEGGNGATVVTLRS